MRVKGNKLPKELHTSFLDFENFLLSRRDEWETKQKEVEAKFLELCSLSDKQEAVRVVSKKRKRTATSDSHPKVEQDPFATYAAEIQVSFFRKVMKYFWFYPCTQIGCCLFIFHLVSFLTITTSSTYVLQYFCIIWRASK